MSPGAVMFSWLISCPVLCLFCGMPPHATRRRTGGECCSSSQEAVAGAVLQQQHCCCCSNHALPSAPQRQTTFSSRCIYIPTRVLSCSDVTHAPATRLPRTSCLLAAMQRLLDTQAAPGAARGAPDQGLRPEGTAGQRCQGHPALCEGLARAPSGQGGPRCCCHHPALVEGEHTWLKARGAGREVGLGGHGMTGGYLQVCGWAGGRLVAIMERLVHTPHPTRRALVHDRPALLSRHSSALLEFNSNSNAVLLQGYRERKGWRRRLRQFRWDTEAAVTIQRFARGFLVRRRLAREARGDSPDQRRQQAATVIQKCYRCGADTLESGIFAGMTGGCSKGSGPTAVTAPYQLASCPGPSVV